MPKLYDMCARQQHSWYMAVRWNFRVLPTSYNGSSCHGKWSSAETSDILDMVALSILIGTLLRSSPLRRQTTFARFSFYIPVSIKYLHRDSLRFPWAWLKGDILSNLHRHRYFRRIFYTNIAAIELWVPAASCWRFYAWINMA